jgi:hypothetical protein
MQNVGLGLLQTGMNLPISAFNDYRVGREAALSWEGAQRQQYMGTGSFANFRDRVNDAMNPFNVQNRSVLQNDVASTLSMGYGAGFGGSTVGERKAAQNVGSLHSMAAMAGINPDQVGGIQASLYSSQSYYKAMAAGIQTRNPTTGDMLSFEEIASQYGNRLKGLSLDEVNRGLMPGGGLYAELEQTWGAQGAEMMAKTIQAQAQGGKTIMEAGGVEGLGLGIDAFGNPATQALDSESARQQSEQERIMEYAPKVTEGIVAVNEQLIKLNNFLTDQGADSIFGKLETVGTGLDTLAHVMPSTADVLLGGIAELVSSLGIAAAAFAAGRGGGGGLLGKGGKGGKGKGAGLKGLKGIAGKAGLAGLGATAVVGGTAAVNGLQDRYAGDTWDAGDTAGTVLGTAGAWAAGGAMIGSIIPGVGTAIGSVVGGVGGALYGAYDSRRESQKRDNNPSTTVSAAQRSGGRPRYAEGSWFIEKDQTADIHYGEMILPNRVAQAVRDEIGRGRTTSQGSGGNTVNIYLTIQRATDAEAARFARRVKHEIESDRELMNVGSGRFG